MEVELPPILSLGDRRVRRRGQPRPAPARLPPPQAGLRAVLVLHYYLGLSASAVAGPSTSHGPAQSRLHRALASSRGHRRRRAPGGQTPDGGPPDRLDGLERDLTSWFARSTSPRDPELTDGVLWVTSRTRQRPRWSFAERWLPTGVCRWADGGQAVPWPDGRPVALLVVLAVAAAAAYRHTDPTASRTGSPPTGSWLRPER
jgi:hypothetical protein